MNRNKLFYSEKSNEWLSICPGCSSFEYSTGIHSFDATWSFNNDLVNPTVSPSLLITYPGGKLPRCHSYITDGKIQFLEDSEHFLNGQTVDIPVWDRVGDY